MSAAVSASGERTLGTGVLAMVLLLACGCGGATDGADEVAGTNAAEGNEVTSGTDDRAAAADGDQDGDGHPARLDCDDLDPRVHFGASEVCNGHDDDCDGRIDDLDPDLDAAWRVWVDADDDGYGVPTAQPTCRESAALSGLGRDCDDALSAVHPGADERCDGLDDDCDGLIDTADPTLVDPLVAFADVDLDGFGDATSPVVACALDSGTAGTAGDCDDTSPARNPTATEHCDGLDNDCDGLVDDADPSLSTTVTWYADEDGDGAGAGPAVVSCLAPTGFVGSATDCDDTDLARGPLATERCNGRDDDCDGLVDDADPDLVDASVWYPDADGDGFGAASGAVSACVAPMSTAAASGDCDDTASARHPGADERCDGQDDDCDGQIDDPWLLDGQYVGDAHCGQCGVSCLTAVPHGTGACVAAGAAPTCKRLACDVGFEPNTSGGCDAAADHQCLPCDTAADCAAGLQCVPMGAGRFCLLPCADHLCPTGFDCADVVAGGVSHCVLDSGGCATVGTPCARNADCESLDPCRAGLCTAGTCTFMDLGCGPMGPRLTRGPYLQNVSQTSGTIVWRTDVSAMGIVRFGRTPGPPWEYQVTSPAGVEHQVTLNQLAPETRYYYEIAALDTALVNGPDYYLTTYPPPKSDRPFSVVAWGDSGVGDAWQLAVANQMDALSPRPAFALVLGDIIYPGGEWALYDPYFFGPYARMTRNMVLWPAFGNHDAMTDNGKPYLTNYVLPTTSGAPGLPSGTELYYSFDYGSAHFVEFDSQLSPRTVGSPMLNWLAADLAAATARGARWKVAYAHHPPYSKGTHDSDTDAQMKSIRDVIVPVLEANGVDVLLTGHSHVYERSYLAKGNQISQNNPNDYTKYDTPDGTLYIVSGCGGQVGSGPLNHPLMAMSKGGIRGNTVLEFARDELRGYFTQHEGTRIDLFTLHKAADTSPPSLASAAATVADTVTLTWDEPVVGGKTGSGAENPAHYTISGGAPSGVAVLSAALRSDGRTIILKTSPLTSGVAYRVTATAVADRATPENLMQTPSSAGFALTAGADGANVPKGARWRYFVGTSEPMTVPVVAGSTWRYLLGLSAPPTAWAAPGFDDNAWKLGQGSIGYGDNDDVTVVAMQSQTVSLYLRRAVTVPSAASVSALTLRVRYDDGFVAYLNGVEVARSLVPPNQTFATPATANHSGSDFEDVDLTPYVGLLVDGANVLAIEGHNRSLQSSGFSLDAELRVGGTDWRAPDFDASGWSEGVAGFGQGDADDVTPLPLPGLTPTLYLRRTFTVAELAPVVAMTLRTSYDDGYVAYVNGVEVARVNVPDGATHASTAITSHEAVGFESIDLTARLDLLRVGANVLAVEGHNASVDSADFSLHPTLELDAGDAVDVPIAAMAVDLDAGSAPLTVTLTDAGSTAGAAETLTGWAWDFGDGNAAIGPGPVSHVYTTSGLYHATLVVTDSAGAQALATRAIFVDVNGASPIAVIGATATTVSSGSTAVFTAAQSTDPDGGLLHYEWDFGEPATGLDNRSASVTPSHTFLRVGEHVVTLRVIDDEGAQAVATLVIAVRLGGLALCPPGANVVMGTEGDDDLEGTSGVDCVLGLGGDDLLAGLGGDDVLIGGAGDDRLDGGSGADVLYGDDGDDDLVGAAGGGQLFGGTGNDVMVILGAGTAAAGEDGNDVIVNKADPGTAGGATVDGGPGEDACLGASCELPVLGCGSGCAAGACHVDAGVCLLCRSDAGCSSGCDVAACRPTLGCGPTSTAPDGLACDDLNPCTQADACVSGECAGPTRSCVALDAACLLGACDPADGQCKAVDRYPGLPCAAEGQWLAALSHDVSACPATQGVAVGEAAYFTGSETSLCRFGTDFTYQAKVSPTVAGVNRMGALDAGDGMVWTAWQNAQAVYDKATLRAKVVRFDQAMLAAQSEWDLTAIAALTSIEAIAVTPERKEFWVADPARVHVFSYAAAQPNLIATFWTQPWGLGQGLRFRAGKLYGLFPSQTTPAMLELLADPTTGVITVLRQWAIDSAIVGTPLQGFAWAPGLPNQVWMAQNGAVRAFALGGL